MLVFDEAVRLKNPYAKWTKRALQLSHTTKHKIIISGLITPNNLMEVYAPFSIVESGILGSSFYQFRDKFFTPDPYSYMNKEWVPKKGAVEKITQIIESLTIRHKKDECLDLPGKIHTCKYLPMEDAQRKAYDSMLKSFMLEIEDGVVTAVSKGVALQKLSQITSGFIYTKDSETNYFKFATAKIKELKSMLEGELINEQVIIFCTYKGEIALFRDHFPESAFIYGGQGSDEQEREIKDFREGINNYSLRTLKQVSMVLLLLIALMLFIILSLIH
jgi:SNF2 family DNA or RNA helicase